MCCVIVCVCVYFVPLYYIIYIIYIYVCMHYTDWVVSLNFFTSTAYMRGVHYVRLALQNTTGVHQCYINCSRVSIQAHHKISINYILYCHREVLGEYTNVRGCTANGSATYS